MKRLFILLAFYVLIGTAAAFEDDFQNHPGNDYSDMWTSTLPDSSTATILNYPVAYSQSKSLELKAKAHLGDHATLLMKYPSTSSYWSFVCRYVSPATGAAKFVKVNYYDSSAALLGSYVIYRKNSAPNIDYIGCTGNTLVELVISGGFLYIYQNGTLQANLGVIAETPTYLEFDTEVWDIGQEMMITFDDVSTSGIVGTNDEFTELNSDFQTTYSIYAKYANPTSTYQQKVRAFSNGSIINTTTLTNYSGFTVYDRLTIFGTNYGYYQIYTTKDGILEASHNILYAPSTTPGSISLDYDDYAIGDDMVATYSLVTPDYGTYDYSAYIVQLSDFSIVASQSITSDSGTKTFDTSEYTEDTYFVFLSRTTGGTQQDFAFDFADVNDAVNLEGTTYNAESGVALGNVSINNSQGATWFNTTSNSSTGAYSLSGLQVDAAINFNASLASYTHTNWTYTPEAGGTEILDLYLIPTAPTFSGTAILGLVGSYPYHQAINGATVNIWNATWSDTDTSSATGYYIFNGLANDSTYTMNATMSGYNSASNINVTVTNGSFVVQNFVLVPAYTLTVTATDSSTGAYITGFTACISGTCQTTTNGSTSFNLDYDLYTVTVSADNYYSSSENVLLDEDKSVTLELTPFYTSDAIPPFAYEKFIVRSLFDEPFSGVTISVYNGSSSTADFTGTTDSMGAAVFKLYKDTYYRIELTGGGLSSDLTYYIYAKEETFLITVVSGFPTGGDLYDDISINLTTSTFNATYSNLSLIYNDTRSSSSSVNFYARNTTTNSTCTVMSSSNTAFLNCTVPATGTYIFGMNATSSLYGFIKSDMVINFNAHNTSAPLVPAQSISSTLLNWASIMIIAFVGSLFSIKNKKHGAVIVPGMAFLFVWFGWLQTSILLVSVAFIIGVLIYMRESESKVVYS